MLTGMGPVTTPNVHPACFNIPGVSDDGFEELCHLVTDYPWNPPWPLCQACLAVSRGGLN